MQLFGEVSCCSSGLLTVAAKKGKIQCLSTCYAFIPSFCPPLPWEGSLTVLIIQMRKLRLQEAPCSRRQVAGVGLGSEQPQSGISLASNPGSSLGAPACLGAAWGCPRSLVMIVKPAQRFSWESNTGQEESVPRDGGQ